MVIINDVNMLECKIGHASFKLSIYLFIYLLEGKNAVLIIISMF